MPFWKTNNSFAVIQINDPEQTVTGILTSVGAAAAMIGKRSEYPFASREELGEVIGKVYNELSPPNECYTLVIGDIPGQTVFEFSLPKVKDADIRSAIELEIPRHIFKNSSDDRYQYTLTPLGETAFLARVQVYSQKEMDFFCELFSTADLRLDAFVPALLLLPELDRGEGIRLPGMAGDALWLDGELVYSDGDGEKVLEAIWKLVRKKFNGANKKDLAMLLGVEKLNTPDYWWKNQLKFYEAVPLSLRINRFRALLKSAAVLVVALLLSLLVLGIVNVWDFHVEYSNLKSESAELLAKTRNMKNSLTSRDREIKEIAKILDMSTGEHEMLIKLAELSAAIPEHVLVDNLRWSENALDMNLRTDQQSVDLGGSLKHLDYWKISRINQRATDTVTTIQLQLTPAAKTPGSAKK